MYRPPDNNCNRVKSIRDMFENGSLLHETPAIRKKQVPIAAPIRNRIITVPRNPQKISAKPIIVTSNKSPKNTKNDVTTKSPVNGIPVLPKTPEKVPPKQSSMVGRNNQLNLTRQLSDPSKCLKRTPAFRLETSGESNFKHKVKQFNSTVKNSDRPTLIKSKSSHDFQLYRKKIEPPNPLDLYTDPIPKSHRALKVTDETSKLTDETSKQKDETSKLTDRTSTLTDQVPKDSHWDSSIHKSSTLKLCDSFTDTLKAALRRPLPDGPPPQKPPRTFAHVSGETPVKKDPRYMLNKLENALRNNKIRKKTKETVVATTTSGEDSDDSLLFKSKPSTINLSCLSCHSDYEPVGESKSSFFVKNPEEPVYALPFQESANVKKEFRNSLYYMSSPVVCDGLGEAQKFDDNSTMKKNDVTNAETQKKMSAENSSLSSFTSDLDSSASTPLDDAEMTSSRNIRHLINRFEDHRVDDLKNTLQKTLDRFCSGDDSDQENHGADERKKSFRKVFTDFQTYVKTMPKYRKCTLNKDDRLFYCCLIVGWDSDGPKMKLKFPQSASVPAKIEDLCFPEATSGPLDKSNNAQCYSLVIMNDKGDRTFGYCRRVIPEGSTRCIPLVYCILSKHRAPHFYRKILKELESRHGLPERLRDNLIAEFYCKPFPKAGECLRIDLSSHNSKNTVSCNKKSDELDLTSYVCAESNGQYGTLNRKSAKSEASLQNGDCQNGRRNTELVLTLHQDSRYEEVDLRPLHELAPEILLKIFASLLVERKVILISCVLSKLSCCVDALQSILYPFIWPHVFIPILPQGWWEIVESPTPVICGILSVAVVNEHKIEHGIVVDLDERNIVSEMGDEHYILSDSMKKSWWQGYNLAKTVSSENYVHSVYLIDAYIKVFIETIKHYKNHISDGKFHKEDFISHGKTRGIRRFLKLFTETAMFITFIETAIANPDSFKLLDHKIEIYGSEESNAIMSKLMEWKK